MWLDNASEIDILFYRPYAKFIAKTICDCENTPLTVGLFGKWGAGKSTLVNLVKAELRDDHNVVVVDTNAWLYEGYTDAKTSLMELITRELHSNQTLPGGIKEKCLSLFRRINKLKMAKSLLNVGINSAALLGTGNPLTVPGAFDGIKGVLDAFSGDEIADTTVSNIAEFRCEFSGIIESLNGKTVIFVVDDLDRCSPERIIDTLEAIKLFLSVDNTVFLIAADEDIIEYSIECKYPGLKGQNSEYGKEYIEKIIQLPITIPLLSVKDIENYLMLLIAQKYFKVDKFRKLLEKIQTGNLHTRDSSLALQEIDDLITSISNSECVYNETEYAEERYKKDSQTISGIKETVARVLHGNPRQTKRFLNTFFAKKALAELYYPGEIDNAILAKILTLYQIDPILFRQLYEWNNHYDGHIPHLCEALSGTDEAKSGWETPDIQKWKACPPENIDEYPLDRYFYLTRENLSSLSSTPSLTIAGKQMLFKIVKASIGTLPRVFGELRMMRSEEQIGVTSTLINSFKGNANDWNIAQLVYENYPTQRASLIDKAISIDAEMPALPFFKYLHDSHIDVFNEIKTRQLKPGTLQIMAQIKDRKR